MTTKVNLKKHELSALVIELQKSLKHREIQVEGLKKTLADKDELIASYQSLFTFEEAIKEAIEGLKKARGDYSYEEDSVEESLEERIDCYTRRLRRLKADREFIKYIEEGLPEDPSEDNNSTQE